MLSGLSIRNVVLIESLDLEFEPGMTALTGETGAGKSIILDALGMATGARSDRSLVRKGADKAQCTASFDLPDVHPVWKILSEADFETDNSDGLIMRRVIGTDGRSKAYINDTPVSVRLLSEIGRHLLEVHGQHDGRGLLDPGQHIAMLDSFGGYHKELRETCHAHADMQLKQLALTTLTEKATKAESERDFLTYAVEELDRLDVRSGEERELAAKRRFLQASEGALEELTVAEQVLGQGDYESRLSSALAGIERIREKVGDDDKATANALLQASQSLERAMLETHEARQSVAAAAQAFTVDPGALDSAEKRFFAIKAAARKYGVESALLIDKRREFAESLSLIDNVDAQLAQAQKDADVAAIQYDGKALALTIARTKASKRLAKAVLKELPALKMERAQFEVRVEEGMDTALGRDKIRFDVATNPGSAMGPMDKVASGGELARFALAIKVALSANEDQVLVFDEVDQGVGGAVASAVGKRLSSLSGKGQVFVVTHSPQVAACANHQYRIEKASSAKSTVTSVIAVAANEREEEIARMLAGETITDEARAAARQLMRAS